MPALFKGVRRGACQGLYSEFGAKVVLTGVSFDGKKLGCASLESENGKTEFLFSDKIPVNYQDREMCSQAFLPPRF